mgnify:CR=1 FL=1
MKIPSALLRTAIVIAAVCASCAASLVAQETGAWKAGVAKTVITPSAPIWMAGFGSRNKPSEGVRLDIYVRAVALQDGANQTSVLVTLDLAGIEREMADEMAERCRKEFGLTRDRLVLNVSHTHSGPVAGLVPMPLYDLEPGQRETVRRYTYDLIKPIQGVSPLVVNFPARGPDRRTSS